MIFNSAYQFPMPSEADPDHTGLVAIGGDLAPQTLLHAYQSGLFPWYNEPEPIAWWSPDPRCVIYPDTYRPSKSLVRQIKKHPYLVSINQCFPNVIDACSSIRQAKEGTWIGQSMISAYGQLHDMGYAHSIEIWTQDGSELIGGLYGLNIGKVFFGESMFHRRTDTSKMAFFVLNQICKQDGFRIIDCQLPNTHLMAMGAVTVSRQEFLSELLTDSRLPTPDWGCYDNRLMVSSYLSQD